MGGKLDGAAESAVTALVEVPPLGPGILTTTDVGELKSIFNWLIKILEDLRYILNGKGKQNTINLKWSDTLLVAKDR